MKILMLGNSFTFYNHLPDMLADLTGAKVVSHTRGGARLAEQLNPNTKMGAKTQATLQDEKWDYVVMQEMSNGPITSKERFFDSVSALSEQIRANGAVPILYATWAYKKGGKQLADFGMDYDEMYRQMHTSFVEAAEKFDCEMADVCQAFYDMAEVGIDPKGIFAEDGCHPNEWGSRIAAQVIADVIAQKEAEK